MGMPTAGNGFDLPLPAGPMHRLIVAVDIEGSTKRTNPVKGALRRNLYTLLERALAAAGIAAHHLEPYSDRGDGVLILIKPHDDVPKTVLLGRLIPILAALLTEHNAAVSRPELRMRLRSVVHAGEVHEDDNGFYGDDLDAAFRFLDAPKAKRALREATASPLILVISEEIFNGIIRQGYLDEVSYQPLGRIRVGDRYRRAWVHVPAPLDSDIPAGIRRPKLRRPLEPLIIARLNEQEEDSAPAASNRALTALGSAGS